MEEEALPLWRQNQIEEEAREKKYRPSLEDLKVFRHSQIEYRRGRRECNGMLEVEEAFGSMKENGTRYDYAFAMLVCGDCGERTAVPNPNARARPTADNGSSWRSRKDTG